MCNRRNGNGNIGGASTGNGRCGCGDNGNVGGASTGNGRCGCGNHGNVGGVSMSGNGCGCGNHSNVGGASTNYSGHSCGGNGSVGGVSTNGNGCGCGNRGAEPFVTDVDAAARRNDDFRRVIWTGDEMQLTLSCLNRDEEVAGTTDSEHDCIICVASGNGSVCFGSGQRCSVSAGDCICIPAGTSYELSNSGCCDLRCFTMFAPSKYPENFVQESADHNDCGCRFRHH